MYGADEFPLLISRVTNAVIAEAIERQSRTFDSVIHPCIVHMVRNSMRSVAWKEYAAVTADLIRSTNQSPKRSTVSFCTAS